MKSTLFAILAALTMMTGTVSVGEGSGESFPLSVAGLTTIPNSAMHAGTGSAAYPDLGGYPTRLSATVNGVLAPADGNKGIL